MLIIDLRMEAEAKDSVTARKVQKADREKLRRDRLNEQFMELGNALGKPSLYIAKAIVVLILCERIMLIVNSL